MRNEGPRGHDCWAGLAAAALVAMAADGQTNPENDDATTRRYELSEN